MSSSSGSDAGSLFNLPSFGAAPEAQEAAEGSSACPTLRSLILCSAVDTQSAAHGEQECAGEQQWEHHQEWHEQEEEQWEEEHEEEQGEKEEEEQWEKEEEEEQQQQWEVPTLVDAATDYKMPLVAMQAARNAISASQLAALQQQSTRDPRCPRRSGSAVRLSAVRLGAGSGNGSLRTLRM